METATAPKFEHALDMKLVKRLSIIQVARTLAACGIQLENRNGDLFAVAMPEPQYTDQHELILE